VSNGARGENADEPSGPRPTCSGIDSGHLNLLIPSVPRAISIESPQGEASGPFELVGRLGHLPECSGMLPAGNADPVTNDQPGFHWNA
jgi:hypothetical protein